MDGADLDDAIKYLRTDDTHSHSNYTFRESHTHAHKKKQNVCVCVNEIFFPHSHTLFPPPAHCEFGRGRILRVRASASGARHMRQDTWAFMPFSKHRWSGQKVSEKPRTAEDALRLLQSQFSDSRE